MIRTATHPRRSRRDESGAAMVEFAFVAVLLVVLVLGIVNFGLILSFKQDMTRAAAEGARAGAVAVPADAWDEANTATAEAVDGFGRACDGSDGMTCNVHLHDCDGAIDTSVPPADTEGDCVTVELVYDYATHPLVVQPPILSAFLPDTLRDSSVARVNS